MRPLLVASVLLSFVAAGSAAAQDRTLNGNVGGTAIAVVVPGSFCPFDPNNPSDARMLQITRQAQAGKNVVVVQFANCEQLAAWRTGQRKVLDDMGGVTSPTQYVNQTIPYTRPQLVEQLAQVYKQQGGSILQGATDEVNKKIGTAAKDMKINETKFLGVLGQDKDAVYIGFLQGLRTEFGDTKVQIGVTGVTLIKGKMLSISVYTPAVSENSSTEALAMAKTIVEKTLAANGG